MQVINQTPQSVKEEVKVFLQNLVLWPVHTSWCRVTLESAAAIAASAANAVYKCDNDASTEALASCALLALSATAEGHPSSKRIFETTQSALPTWLHVYARCQHNGHRKSGKQSNLDFPTEQSTSCLIAGSRSEESICVPPLRESVIQVLNQVVFTEEHLKSILDSAALWWQQRSASGIGSHKSVSYVHAFLDRIVDLSEASDRSCNALPFAAPAGMLRGCAERASVSESSHIFKLWMFLAEPLVTVAEAAEPGSVAQRDAMRALAELVFVGYCTSA